MRLRLLIATLCVLLFASLFSIPAVNSAGSTPTQGVIGTEVTVSGLTPGQSYTIKWDGSSYKVGAVSATGTATFSVPESSTGSHTLNVESPTGTSVYSVTFTVVPSIQIDPTSGIVGTTITVKGYGFTASEEQVKVTFDGSTVKSGLTANSYGSWETTFAAPAIVAGNHTIDASGNNTSATIVADKTFSVQTNLTIKPTFGSVGTEVTVSGSGFAASETGISFTYDGAQIKTGITAGSNGSWTATFLVPQSTKGEHVIDASGSSTSASSIPDVTFSVSPGILVEPNTVFVGDQIKITGSGFENNESDIRVLFDSLNIQSDIKADQTGYWSTVFTIPESVNGKHDFDASGSTTTVSDVQNAAVTIKARLVLKPEIGHISENISVSGTGFSKSKSVSVDYGGKQLPVTLSTDSKGSFSTSITPLEGMSGQITVQAKDADGVTAAAAFSMETTPPDVPRIASPKDGARVGYVGDTKVTFDWTDVTDPSGVYYTLQISSKLDFSDLLLEVPKLTKSEYTLTEAESLAPGEYFWRIKATDKAGNSSAWVGPMVVKTAFTDIKTAAIAVVVFIAFLIIISTVPRAFAKPKKQKSRWEEEEERERHKD